MRHQAEEEIAQLADLIVAERERARDVDLLVQETQETVVRDKRAAESLEQLNTSKKSQVIVAQ